MTTIGPRWKCPRPGCEYVAQLLPSSNLEMVIHYHEQTNHAARGDEPSGHPEFSPGAYEYRPEDEIDGSGYTRGPDVIIWDDPPPDPDRPIDNQVILDWYLDRFGAAREAEDRVWVTETEEVRCGTWVVPAACVVGAAAAVYLAWRWSGR